MSARIVRPLILIAALVVLALLPMFGISIPGVFDGPLSSPGTLNLLGLCFVFGALALTYDLVFGYVGLLSFGHALYFATGVYITAIALGRWHWSLPAALAFTALVSIVLPLVLGAICLRMRDIPFAMVTLAFAQAASVLVLQNADDDGGDRAAGDGAQAADDDDDEGEDQHRGTAQRIDRAVVGAGQHAREPRGGAAERENERKRTLHVNAERRDHRAIFNARAHDETVTRTLEKQQQRGQHEHRDRDDEKARERNVRADHGDRTIETRRQRQLNRIVAETALDQRNTRKRETDRHEHLADVPRVQRTNQQRLRERGKDRARHDRDEQKHEPR